VCKLVSTPVDRVFLANAFQGVPNPPLLARALKATLIGGGWFAIVNWQRHPREETVILGEPRGSKYLAENIAATDDQCRRNRRLEVCWTSRAAAVSLWRCLCGQPGQVEPPSITIMSFNPFTFMYESHRLPNVC